MIKLKSALVKIFYNVYILYKINWGSIVKNYRRNAETVVIFYINFPKNFFNLFVGGGFVNDFSLLNAVIKNNIPYSIKLGSKGIEKIKGKTIIYNLSQDFGFYRGDNYAESLQNLVSDLGQSNVMIPNLENILFWENKIYMHEQFVKLGIPHPKTILVSDKHPLPEVIDIPFPVLFKPANSNGSIGIEKFNDEISLKKFLSTNHGYKDYMIQEWIDMKKDIRMIYVGNTLEVHYWRINQSDEWKPTSTGHGSKVDFDTLPDKWMPYIFEQYKKLNLKAAAFDITWRNDDLSTEPVFLEVSPSFRPNPAPSDAFKNKSYKSYKKSLWGPDTYFKRYINLDFEMKEKLIGCYLNDLKKNDNDKK